MRRDTKVSAPVIDKLSEDERLWDASLDIPPPPCEWHRIILVRQPGGRLGLADACPNEATYRVVRRDQCAHGMPFPPSEQRNLICAEHAERLRTHRMTCHACGCKGQDALAHMILVLEPIQ